MRFEWDHDKNRINQRKHDGLSFQTAARVFNDPFVIFREDRVVEGEQRWHAIGSVSGGILLVVHVNRTEDQNEKDEIIRIISAREANRRECRIYLLQAGD